MSSTTKSPKIDREAAAKINPIVSDIDTPDTLGRSAGIVRDLSVIVSYQGEIELPLGQLPLILETIAAALDYEAENLTPAIKSKAKGERAK